MLCNLQLLPDLIPPSWLYDSHHNHRLMQCCTYYTGRRFKTVLSPHFPYPHLLPLRRTRTAAGNDVRSKPWTTCWWCSCQHQVKTGKRAISCGVRVWKRDTTCPTCFSPSLTPSPSHRQCLRVPCVSNSLSSCPQTARNLSLRMHVLGSSEAQGWRKVQDHTARSSKENQKTAVLDRKKYYFFCNKVLWLILVNNLK